MLKIDYDARRPDEPEDWNENSDGGKWKEVKLLPSPSSSLDLQGRERMDISAIIGDRFFSVYFMTKYPFVCTQDSRAI